MSSKRFHGAYLPSFAQPLMLRRHCEVTDPSEVAALSEKYFLLHRSKPSLHPIGI
jgi:hypothetical protein